MTDNDVERLLQTANDYAYGELAKCRAEIEQLREHVDALRLVATSHEPEALRLQAEIERLRTTLGYLADNISDPALVAVAEETLKVKL